MLQNDTGRRDEKISVQNFGRKTSRHYLGVDGRTMLNEFYNTRRQGFRLDLICSR